jgi:hypothetical protein
MSRYTVEGICACCGRQGKLAHHGWAVTCYHRWLKAGRPADGPPPPLSPRQCQRMGALARAGTHLESLLYRVARFESLRRGDGLSIGKAAAALGVSHRTGDRYAALIKVLRQEGKWTPSAWNP